MSVLITHERIYTEKDFVYAAEPYPHYWWRTVETGKDGVTRTWRHEVPLSSVHRVAILEKEEEAETGTPNP